MRQVRKGKLRIVFAAAILMFLSLPATAQGDLANELLKYRESYATPGAHETLGLKEYHEVLNLLFPDGDEYGRVKLRREPSFGYPTQITILMGSRWRALSYEISNPIVVRTEAVSFYEHLDFLAWKLGTNDPNRLAKQLRVKQSEIDASVIEPFIRKLEASSLVPKFNRTDTYYIVADGTRYSITVSNLSSEYKFESNTGAERTPAQDRLYKALKQVWKQVFPSIDFESAR